jgi:hypothetical protein
MRLALVVVLSTAAAAADKPGVWTPAVVDAGVTACEKSLPHAYCVCVTETARQRYTLDDYLAVEQAAKPDQSPQVKVIAEDCLRRHNQTDADVHK